MNASALSSLYYRFISLSVSMAGNGSRVERISNMVSSLRGAVSSSRNSLYMDHLKRIFPEKDEAWRINVLSGYWRVHERNIFSLFYLRNKVYKDLKDNVSWSGRENLENAIKAGNGVLLLVPHFGDERSLHVILGMEGYPVDVVTSRYSDMPTYARECRLGIGRKWNNLHFPDENPRWMFRTLQEGRILHYASTAYGGPGGTWVTSFGVPVLVPSAPWKLRRRTNCKIVVASCEQTENMGFNLSFRAVDPPLDEIGFAQAIAGETEKLASQYPSQYEWKNLLIRHRESNTIARIKRIPEIERELEKLAEYEDANPSTVLTVEGILNLLN